MALSANVIGLTRSEQEEAAKQRALQIAQLAVSAGLGIGNLGLGIGQLKENARQFDVTDGFKALAGDLTPYEFFQTEEGRRAGAKYAAAFSGINPRDPAALESWMRDVSRSPQSAEVMARASQYDFLTNRVEQITSQGGNPSEDSIVQGILAKLGPVGQAPAPRGGVQAAVADDRTLVPPAPPVAAPAPAPTLGHGGERAALGTGGQPAVPSSARLDAYQARARGDIPGDFAGPADATSRAAPAPKVEYQVRPDRIMGGTGFVIDEYVDGKPVKTYGANGTDFLAPGSQPYKSAEEAQAAVQKYGRSQAGSTPAAPPPKAAPTSYESSDYAQPGVLKPEAAPQAVVLNPQMSFREFAMAKQKAGALGGDPVKLTGDDTALRAANGPTFDEYIAFRGGRNPQWGAQTAPAAPAGAAPAPAATASAKPSDGTIAGAVQAAASPGSGNATKEDIDIARFFLTKSGDTEGLASRGLQPMTDPQEMKRAEALLVSRQKALAGEVTRTWKATPRGSFDDQINAQRSAEILQKVGGNLPPEQNAYLQSALTNWTDLKVRGDEATIAKTLSEAGLNRAQTQYYLGRLDAERTGDALDFIARMDENASKVIGNAVSLINGTYKDKVAELNKIDDPEKRLAAFAKVIAGDKIFEAAMTGLTRSLSQLLDLKDTEQLTKYVYGGLLGIAQKSGMTAVPGVSAYGKAATTGTDISGEAAGYEFGQ